MAAVRLHLGCVITPLRGGGQRQIPQGALAVDGCGALIGVGTADDLCQLFAGAEVSDWGSCLLLPGAVDLHTHLPQYAFSGIGGDLTLLDWLQTYTFPHEARHADLQLARSEARTFFRDCLRHGTTTVVAFTTSNPDATDVAFAEAQQLGVRAWLGNVLMDRFGPPQLLRDITLAMQDCVRLADLWDGRERLRYVVTPRFAVSCTPEMLSAAGRFAQERGLYLQSHVGETLAEVAFVQELFPAAESYCHVYDDCQCLGSRTLLAHGIYLTDSELSLMHARGVSVVHCPTSNRFLASGLMPYRRLQKAGIGLAVGSDVAGGFSLSVFREGREAVETSKLLASLSREAEESDRPTPLGVEEALRLSTLAGAEILGQGDIIGSLEIGKQADFVVVDDAHCVPGGALLQDSFFTSPSERLMRVLYRCHPEMVKATFIAGGCVWRA